MSRGDKEERGTSTERADPRPNDAEMIKTRDGDGDETSEIRRDKDLTLSSHAHAVGVVVRAQRPVVHRSLHENQGPRLVGATEQIASLVRWMEHRRRRSPTVIHAGSETLRQRDIYEPESRETRCVGQQKTDGLSEAARHGG